MQVKYITRISFTARWTTKEQRKGTICRCVFTQVIVYNQHIFSLFHPLFTDGTAGIWCNILQWCQFTCRRSYDSSIVKCPIVLQCLYNICHSRGFLSDSHIDTKNILVFLIQNGINGNGRFTGLTVSNNQLTLTSSNRNHGVNCFNSCLKWCIHRLTGNNSACHTFYRTGFIRVDWSFAINRLSQSIYNTT